MVLKSFELSLPSHFTAKLSTYVHVLKDIEPSFGVILKISLHLGVPSPRNFPPAHYLNIWRFGSNFK